MNYIRKATIEDIPRIAEILIFTKRMSYRKIFCDDRTSFNEMQVVSTAQVLKENPEGLDNIWVYDDGVVKAVMIIAGQEIVELYVDYFFQRQGIGTKLVKFATQEKGITYLRVLVENAAAITFYQSLGFVLTDDLLPEENAPTVFNVKMVLASVME